MRGTKRLFCTIFVLLAVSLIACTTVFAGEAQDWDAGTITVEGYGTAPINAVYAQGKILARRAAIVDAYRNLAEETHGVSVDGTTTVKDAMVASDVINTSVRAVIKGAKVISSEYMDDGSCKVVMQLNIFGENSLASAVLRPGLSTEAAKTPGAFGGSGAMAADVPDSARSMTALGGYTGLIIDCTELGLKPVMSPVIKTIEGMPIYGYKNLDSKKVISYGMAGYTHSVTEAARAGTHPLIVKAVSLENFDAYPVISKADADRILVENQASHFLDACAVVFVR